MAVILKRIGWENKPSKKTPANASNFIKMENNTQEAITELEKKPILKARINRQRLRTSGNYGKATIPLGTTEINYDNEGGCLTLSNNEIVISNKAILIEVIVFTRGIGFYGNAGDKSIILQKNGEKAEASYQSNNTGYHGICISTCLLVNKGDRISVILESQNPGETEILEGYLQVKVVK